MSREQAKSQGTDILRVLINAHRQGPALYASCCVMRWSIELWRFDNSFLFCWTNKLLSWSSTPKMVKQGQLLLEICFLSPDSSHVFHTRSNVSSGQDPFFRSFLRPATNTTLDGLLLDSAYQRLSKCSFCGTSPQLTWTFQPPSLSCTQKMWHHAFSSLCSWFFAHDNTCIA